MNIMCTIVDEIGDEYWMDEVGGYHSPPIGVNPNGYRCGECNSLSCKDCWAERFIYNKDKSRTTM